MPGVQREGDTGLTLDLTFPDSKARDEFEVVFRGWVTQQQHALMTERLAGALASPSASPAEDAEVSGYWYKVTVGDTVINYWDCIPGW